MKNLVLIALVLFSQINLLAQTKQDVLSCFEKIITHPKLERALQIDLPNGKGIVLGANLNPNINPKLPKDFSAWHVVSEDFYNFPVAVLLADGHLQQTHGIEPGCELAVDVEGNEQHLRFYIRNFIKEEFRTYRWIFQFEKEANQWVMKTSDEYKEEVRIGKAKWK